MEKYIHKYKNLSPVLRAGIWFTICNFIQKGISFLTVPVFTRIMSTEEYGLFSIYTSWYSILTIFCTLHLSYYVFDKGLVKFEDDREGFVVSIQSLSATITLIIIVVYFLARGVVNQLINMPASMMLCMFAQIFFEPPVLYWTARKRFEYKYQAVIVVTIAIAVLNPVLGFAFIKANLFSNSAFSRVFSIALVSFLFGVPLASSICKRGHLLFNIKYWPYALAFNVPLIPHFLSTTILSSADRIMIGNMVGQSEAGIYSVAYSIGMVCTLFSQAINHAFLPWLYKKMKKDDYTGIPNITMLFLTGMFAVLLMLICFAPEVVWIVGSEQYMDAIWVIPPVCGSIFFIFLRDLFANIEYYFEKTKIVSLASVGVAILNIILNYIFIRIFGYLAAGYTTLFCYLSFCIVHYAVMNHLCKQNNIKTTDLFNIKRVVFISSLFLISIGVMLCVYNYHMIRYAILIITVIVMLSMRNRIIETFKAMKR